MSICRSWRVEQIAFHLPKINMKLDFKYSIMNSLNWFFWICGCFLFFAVFFFLSDFQKVYTKLKLFEEWPYKNSSLLPRILLSAVMPNYFLSFCISNFSVKQPPQLFRLRTMNKAYHLNIVLGLKRAHEFWNLQAFVMIFKGQDEHLQ